MTITVSASNGPPVANDDHVTAEEDIPVTGNVLTNDSDPDGDSLTASLVLAPVNGTIVLNADGSFTYTPNANFHGPDTVTYSITDGHGADATAVLFLQVLPVNDAPVAVDDTATTPAGTPVNGNLLTNDSDPDGDQLTLSSLVGAPGHGSLLLSADGSFTYEPNDGYAGPDELGYEICDNGTPSLCDTATLHIEIVAGNRAPVAVDDSFTVDDGPLVGNLLTNDHDPDGDALTASLVTAPQHGVVTLNAHGSFTYTAQDTGVTDTFDYQVCDGPPAPLCDTATVTITIPSDNQAPVAVDDAFTVDEDDVLQDDVSTNDSDPDGDDLAYTLDSNVTEGSLVLEVDGSFSYTPAPDFHGDDSFTYTVTDPDGLTAAGTVSITVAAQPDVPVTRGDAYDATAGEALRVTAADGVLANDTDPDLVPAARVTAARGTAATMRLNAVVRAFNGLTATVADGPRHGSLRLDSNGGFSYTPEPGYVGADSFSYTASNASMTSSPQKVSFKVGPGKSDNPNNPDDPAPPIDDSDQAATPPPASLPDTGGPEQAALWLSLLLLVGGGLMMRGRRSTSA